MGALAGAIGARGVDVCNLSIKCAGECWKIRQKQEICRFVQMRMRDIFLFL